MTWLDWLVVAMGIFFVLQGLFKGAALSLLSGLAIVVAYVVSAVLLSTAGETVADALVGSIKSLPKEWARTAGFLLPFILVYLLLSVLINIMPGGKRPGMQAQVLGVFAGALKAFVAAMALVGVLLASPLSGGITKDIERSPIVRPVAASQRVSIKQLRSMSPIPFPPVGPDHKF
jgi:ABC-type transport system involved in multi-copper enzyme maturation permease subunit